MRIGISTYTYTWSFGVPGNIPSKQMTGIQLIDKANEFGLSCIQIADNYPLDKLTDKQFLEMAMHAEKNKIEIEVGTRGLMPMNIFTYLEIAKKLNSPILRVVIDANGYEPSIDEIILTIKGIIPALKKLEIRLAIENHDRIKAKEFEQIILKTDPEWVGICLDSVNSMGAGEGFETVVNILGPYTINLHVKDYSIHRVDHKMGFVIEGTPAGKGMLDIPTLFKQIDKFEKCQSAILELWTSPENTIDKTIEKEIRWAKESVSYLKKIII